MADKLNFGERTDSVCKHCACGVLERPCIPDVKHAEQWRYTQASLTLCAHSCSSTTNALFLHLMQSPMHGTLSSPPIWSQIATSQTLQARQITLFMQYYNRHALTPAMSANIPSHRSRTSYSQTALVVVEVRPEPTRDTNAAQDGGELGEDYVPNEARRSV